MLTARATAYPAIAPASSDMTTTPASMIPFRYKNQNESTDQRKCSHQVAKLCPAGFAEQPYPRYQNNDNEKSMISVIV